MQRSLEQKNEWLYSVGPIKENSVSLMIVWNDEALQRVVTVLRWMSLFEGFSHTYSSTWTSISVQRTVGVWGVERVAATTTYDEDDISFCYEYVLLVDLYIAYAGWRGMMIPLHYKLTLIYYCATGDDDYWAMIRTMWCCALQNTVSACKWTVPTDHHRQMPNATHR